MNSGKLPVRNTDHDHDHDDHGDDDDDDNDENIFYISSLSSPVFAAVITWEQLG